MCGWSMPLRNVSGRSPAAVDGWNRRGGWWGIGRWASRLQSGHPDPGVRVAGALSVLVPAALGVAFVIAVLPWASWVVFAFGWMLFPVVGQLVGGVVELGRRAVAAPPAAPSAWTAASGAIGAATDGRENVVWRIGRGVVALPAGETREDAERIYLAAKRLAATTTDPTAADEVRGRFLEPTADLLDRYGRLLIEGPTEVRLELTRIADEFPRLAQKLEAVAEALRLDDGRPNGAGATGLEATEWPRAVA